MIDAIIQWINKPYAQIESNRVKLALSLTVGLICFIFLTVFRPFDLDQVDSVSYILGFGAVATISLIIMYFLLPRVFKSYFSSERWTVGKEIIFFIIVHLLIAIGCYMYNTYVGILIDVPQHSLSYFVYIVICVGILPMLFMIYVTEKIAFNRHYAIAGIINDNHTLLPTSASQSLYTDQSISIRSTIASEKVLVIDPQYFIYAQASSNYCDIYYLDLNGVLVQKLLRVSLKSLREQMAHFPQIMRVHKSYLINQKYIKRAEGNARSLYLELTHIQELIPVSRSFDRSLISNGLN